MLIADGELHFGAGRRTKVEEEAQGILALISHLPNSEWRQYRYKEGADITDPTIYERYAQRWNSTLNTFDRASEAAGTGMTVRSMRTFVGSGLVKTLSQGAESWAIAQTVASAASAVLNALVVPAATITITGSTNITTATGFNAVSLGRPTLSAASALTVTNASTLYISNAPVGGGAGPAAITNTYAIWVDDGPVRFDSTFTLTGPIDIASGTAAAPAYTFTGDLNTGMYRIGADRLGFSTAGVAAWEINATGDLVSAIAATQLVPGATSFALRNNANNASNVTVTDAGVVSVVRDVLNPLAGFSARLPSASAAGQTVNPADATALDITTVLGQTYAGTVGRFRLPGIIAAAAGGAVTLQGVSFSQRAMTDPGVGTAQAVTVTQLVVTGAAGIANITGAYTWRGMDLSTPAQAANGAINVAEGIAISGGATAGAAGSYQRGVRITMNAATDAAILIAGGYLGFSVAASQLVPGAASFSLRDNSNARDNVLVTNAGLVTVAGGHSTLLLSATAAGQTVNAADATALDITSSAALAYTGTVAQLRTPGLVAGAGGDTGAIALTALNISGRAFTNPGGATALVPTVTGIAIGGPAGQVNITGVYTWRGVDITTPAHAANAAANVATGLRVTTGASDGAGGATQTAINIVGGAQTAGAQRGLFVTMADVSHLAINVATGVSLFADGIVTAPGIGFAADPNTGLYRVGADNFAAVVNGASVLTYAATAVSTAGAAILTSTAGAAYQLPAATAAGQTVNPSNVPANDITTVAGQTYTGILQQLSLPGLIVGAAGGAVNYFGLNLQFRALTNPGGALAQALTVVGINFGDGAAGQVNITGAYTWRGIDMTTPNFVANTAINVATGVRVTLGTANGAATTTQTGFSVTGGAQTAGFQRGLYVNMAATTHDGIYVDQGRTRLDGDLFVRGGNSEVVAKTYTTDATIGDIVYTAAQVYGGVFLRDPAGGARSDTMPTAAALVAAIPNAAVGDTFEFVLVNTADAAEVITVGAGAGMTLVPASVTPTQNEITRFLIRLTNIGGGTEACVAYAITAGA